MCFTDLAKAYDSADRTLTVLARFGVPRKVLAVIRHLLPRWKACVRASGRTTVNFRPARRGAGPTARMRARTIVVQ